MEKLLIHLNIEHAVCLSLASKHWNANEARTECLLRCFGVSFGVRRDSNVLSRGTFRNGSSPRFAEALTPSVYGSSTWGITILWGPKSI